MTLLPWSSLGLDDGFACTNLELRIAAPGHLDHLEHGKVSEPETLDKRAFHGLSHGLCDPAVFGEIESDDQGSFANALRAELDALPRADQPTPAHPRRDHFGRIELCEPCLHPALLLRGATWFAGLTGLGREEVREITQQSRHLVLDATDGSRAPGSTIAKDELHELDERERNGLQHQTGAKAIHSLLGRRGHADLDPRIDRVYVVPIQLRPIVPGTKSQLDAADLNDLYRRVINRNFRLSRLLELDAPEIIVRNERAYLQAAIDSLFDNSACAKPVLAIKRRPLESLRELAGGEALAERLRGLDQWVSEHGFAGLERGLPWALFQTWRAIQALGFELGEALNQ